MVVIGRRVEDALVRTERSDSSSTAPGNGVNVGAKAGGGGDKGCSVYSLMVWKTLGVTSRLWANNEPSGGEGTKV